MFGLLNVLILCMGAVRVHRWASMLHPHYPTGMWPVLPGIAAP